MSGEAATQARGVSLLLALPCRPFKDEEDAVENIERMVYRKGYADVSDSRMQVTTWLGERVRLRLGIQIETQKLGRVTVREVVMVSKRYDL
jgi:hypothetical protein